MNITNKTKARMIASCYGFPHQLEILVEECAEAIQAAQKYKRDKTLNNLSHFREEVADIIIMAEQMKQFIGENTIQELITQKLDRQLKRMEVEELC